MLSRRSFLDTTVRAGLAGASFAAALAPRPTSAAPTLKPVPGSPFATGGVAGTSPYWAAFDPTGKYLATANNGGNGVASSVSLFGVNSSGGLILVGTAPTGPGTPNSVSVAFSPDGALLAAANYGTHSVAVHAVPSLAPLSGSPFATGPGKSPYSVAFNPKPGNNATTVLVAANWLNDNTLSVFPYRKGGSILKAVAYPSGFPPSACVGFGTGPEQVAFHPGGSYLATADSMAGCVSLFALQPNGSVTLVGAPVPTTPNGSSPTCGAVVNTLAFSPNGFFLATGIGFQATVQMFKFSAPTLTLLGSPVPTGAASQPNAVAFHPSGNLLAAASGGSVALFAVKSSGTLTLLGSPAVDPGNPNPNSVAFSPNGKWLAAGTKSGSKVSMFAVT